jgi:3-oxoadipate enol-lactonase
MPAVKVGDVNIYYEIHGKGEPLVLIMGYGGHIGHWFRLVPLLSREYCVVVFDNSGTGRSDKPDMPYTMEMMAGDTAGLLDAIGIDAAHIFGVSMGGCIAQQFALGCPERVSSLILGCTHCGGSHRVRSEPWIRELLHDFERIKQLTPEEHASEILDIIASQEFIRSNKDIVDQYIRKVTEHDTPIHGLIGQYEAIIDHDTYNRLPEIQAPTLVICGDADKMIPAENSRLLAFRIPDAELIMLENIGHGFFIEAVEEANKAIMDFLKRHHCPS